MSDQSENILYIEEFNKSGYGTFGYDKSGLTGFLKKEELTAAYNKSDLIKVKREAALKNIAQSNKIIYNQLFFTQVTDQFKFGTGKGKEYNYTELTSTLEKVLNAFKSKTDIKETLTNANNVWAKEVTNVNLGDKKSRINRKVATSVYGNLALANMYLNNFEKAKEYSKEYSRLANMAVDQAIPERAKTIRFLIKDRAIRYEANKDLDVSNNKPTAAPVLSNIMSSRTEKHEFVSQKNKYSLFIEELTELQEKIAEENNTSETVETSLPSSGVDKYRARIQYTELQGNTLFLNNWYDKDIEGKELPKEICELTELNELRPYGLSLTAIPVEIGNLVNLKKLDLSGNNLTSLPSSIGKLTNLKVLNLANNNLSKLPVEIKSLSNLKKLNIKGNKFSKSDLQKLKNILPKGCKIKS